jgi:hypothetical protein
LESRTKLTKLNHALHIVVLKNYIQSTMKKYMKRGICGGEFREVGVGLKSKEDSVFYFKKISAQRLQ